MTTRHLMIALMTSFLLVTAVLQQQQAPTFALSPATSSSSHIALAPGNSPPLTSNITYQGLFQDAGDLANGLYDFEFKLFDALTSGNQVGPTVIVDDLNVVNGLFTADLGFGSIFNDTLLWLEIAVRAGGSGGFYTTLTPRQALTAAPHALFATTAPWSGLLNIPAGFADGTDNDTTYTAGTGLTVTGGSFSLSLSYSLPQGCSSGSIPEWNGSSWVCGLDDSGGDYWSFTGNSGTAAATNFLGTTDNQPLQLRVNNARALLLQPNPTSPNLVGGYTGNTVTNAFGATIGGGGQNGAVNTVGANFGTVSGGANNAAQGIYTTVSGGQNNTAADWNATVSGGYFNTADGLMATVGGGSSNSAIGDYATVAGGVANNAQTFATTVGGGNDNDATASGATISGGQYNDASNFYAAIGGGVNNSARGVYATIGGGDNNAVQGESATIAGGSQMTVTANYGSIGGGQYNVVSGIYSTIGGGRFNTISSEHATIGGGIFNNVAEDGATVAGGSANTAIGYYATVGGGNGLYAEGYATTISGGEQNTVLGHYGTVGGGNLNHTPADYGTVAGGNGNTTNSYAGTIGGGSANYVTEDYATIAGGRWNRVEALLGTIGGGGYHNPADRNYVTDEGGTIAGGGSNEVGNNNGVPADAYYATVGGGWDNTASNKYVAVSGGHGNVASGVAAAIPGGWINTAAGDYSFAAGCQAQANHAGSFVWADSRTCTPFTSQRNYQFRVRAWGGAMFDDDVGNWVTFNWGQPIDTSTGAHLSWGGTWTNASDVNLKENFEAVDGHSILEAVAHLPIQSWNYKSEDDEVRHLGPTAQDFQAAFGLGDSATAISTVDADGVALTAIQALYRINQEQAAQIEALEARLATLEKARQGERPLLNNLNGMPGWTVLIGLLLFGLSGMRRQG